MFLRFLWYCLELLKNQWLEPNKLRRLQEKRLKVILRHAYRNVEFYHKKWDSVSVKPDDIKSIDDLTKLPFTTKREILSKMEGGFLAKGYSVDKCLKMPTSGTSGGLMPVYYDKRFWDYACASYYRVRRAIGINPWDKIFQIYYWGPQPSSEEEAEEGFKKKGKSRYRTSLVPLYFLLRRFQKTAFITYDAEEIISQIMEYQPSVLSGNSSYLRLVAEIAKDTGRNLHLKAVRTSGEVLEENTRQFLEHSFSCRVFDSYWANELYSIAWECKRKEGQHISADLLILEIIRDGEPVGPHEPGEIVVTGLLNYAMPLIRYRVGDIGILDDEQCSCGRSFPLLKSVEGRCCDCFTLPNGQTVTPKTIMSAVQGTPGVSRYQVVQESRNKVTVELMKHKNDPEVSISELTARCREVLGEDMEIEVFTGTRENLKAKFRPAISKLRVGEEPRWISPRG